jgi:hypothetical protein
MCLIYLLFSLICSAVSELVEGFARNRAADLERGVRELLSHGEGNNPVEALYNHPLIYSLFSGPYKMAADKKWWQPGPKLPSYIPSRNFSLAILDLAVPAGPGQKSGAATDLEQLRTGVLSSTFINDKTKRALVTLIDTANNDIEQARKNVEAWYDSAMDRVSGWYKRRTQVIITVFALLIAAALNIDSIALANNLATDKSVRDSLVAAAPEYARQATTSATETLKHNVQELETRGLAIGWTDRRAIAYNAKDWWLKALGWILSACAASLGAPFWFDLLNRFIVVRSTVKPQEKSHDEPSKD